MLPQAHAVDLAAAPFSLGAHLTTPRHGFVHHGIYIGGGRVALGTMVLADLRLLARLGSFGVRLDPPASTEARAIGVALGVLVLSGALLVAFSVADRADAIANPKLQAKVLLVGVLVANGVLLHVAVFPWLARGEPVRRWRAGRRALVSLAVGLSNSLWLYVAFLGVARPWNFGMPLTTLLSIALGLWCLCAAAVRVALAVAAREHPGDDLDGIDRLKGALRSLRSAPPAGA